MTLGDAIKILNKHRYRDRRGWCLYRGSVASVSKNGVVRGSLSGFATIAIAKELERQTIQESPAEKTPPRLIAHAMEAARKALHNAWIDIGEWIQLAEKQTIDISQESFPYPTEAGVKASRRTQDRISDAIRTINAAMGDKEAHNGRNASGDEN